MNEQLLNKKIKEIMNVNPHCISPTSTISDVLLQMEAYEINHLPVTDTGKSRDRLIGIVTRRDLERHLSGNLSEAHLPVEEFMSPLRADYGDVTNRMEAHILGIDDTIRSAIDFFAHRLQIPGHANKQPYISALLVTDEESTVQGIVSYKDILREIIQSEIEWTEQTVREHMTPVDSLTTINKDTPFSDVFALFRTNSFRTLPVIEQADECRKLIGLVEDISAFEMLKSNKRNEEEIFAGNPALMYGVQHLHLILADENINNVLPFFLERPYHDALLVVKDLKSQCLIGLLSYVDVYKHILDSVKK